MEKVFAVFERVDYEGSYLRGVYSSREEAESRMKLLKDSSNFPDVEEYVVRELSVGEDMDII